MSTMGSSTTFYACFAAVSTTTASAFSSSLHHVSTVCYLNLTRQRHAVRGTRSVDEREQIKVAMGALQVASVSIDTIHPCCAAGPRLNDAGGESTD